MKVTIITVTYNAGRYLADCISSIQDQDYPHIEHIVIDGGSTDNTLDIISQYENGIYKWISEPDSGMYDALNKGLKLATGDIIGILNSDDILDNKSVISTIVKTFKMQTEVGAVYGDLEFIHPEDKEKIIRVWKGKPFKRSRFHLGWMPAHPTFYVRHDLVRKYGMYETMFFTASDYEFMLRYLYKHHVKACYIPELFVRMRTGGQSDLNIKQRLRANRRDYLAMKFNGVPFAFFVSILKPLLKIGQFKKSYFSSKPVQLNDESKVVSSQVKIKKLERAV